MSTTATLLERLYAGKAKSVYLTSDPTLVVQRFKDEATAFNGKKHARPEGKGELNNRISSLLFRFFRHQGIDSHYVETLNTRDMLVRRVTIIPLEVVVRNVAAGSLAQRLGWDEGRVLPHPIVETYYKNDALGDPLLAEEHVRVLGLLKAGEWEEIRAAALQVNEVARALFAQADLDLQDFKLEFGRDGGGRIVLADEFSPDTSRLWDRRQPGRRMDKDVFRRDLADLVETYTEVHARLCAVSALQDFLLPDLAPAPDVA